MKPNNIPLQLISDLKRPEQRYSPCLPPLAPQFQPQNSLKRPLLKSQKGILGIPN